MPRGNMDGWKADRDDKIHTTRYSYPFEVSAEYENLAYVLKEELDRHGIDFDTFVAGLLGSYDHVIERVADEYDAADVPNVDEEVEDRRLPDETPEEILDGMVDPADIPSEMTVQQAKELKDRFARAVVSSADDWSEGPPRAVQEALNGGDNDE